jgi:hypothetical protein
MEAKFREMKPPISLATVRMSLFNLCLGESLGEDKIFKKNKNSKKGSEILK